MSTSQPSPTLIRTVSRFSFSSLPRRGTLMSPSSTCRTTACPSQFVYPVFIKFPPELGLDSVSRWLDSRTRGCPAMVQRGYRPSISVLSAPPFLCSINIFQRVLSYRCFRTRVPSLLPRHTWDSLLRDETPSSCLLIYSRACHAPRHRPGARRWFCPRLRASGGSSRPGGAEDSHLLHFRQQHRQHPGRRLCQWHTSAAHHRQVP